MTAQVQVLGAIRAQVNGRARPLGGHRQRAVLARLPVARGNVVSADRLIDDLWRGEPPAKAPASLQTYISLLRRALEPDRPPRSPARVLVSAAPGYAIHLDDEAVDAWLFERLVGRARECAAAGEGPARRGAGAVARGGVRGGRGRGVGRRRGARLSELRLGAEELLVAATLRSAPAAVEEASLAQRMAVLRASVARPGTT